MAENVVFVAVTSSSDFGATIQMAFVNHEANLEEVVAKGERHNGSTVVDSFKVNGVWVRKTQTLGDESPKWELEAGKSFSFSAWTRKDADDWLKNRAREAAEAEKAEKVAEKVAFNAALASL